MIIDFELQAQIGDKYLCFTLFLNFKNLLRWGLDQNVEYCRHVTHSSRLCPVARYFPPNNITVCLIYKFTQKDIIHSKELFASQKNQQIRKYNNFPPCVTVKWRERRIPPFNFLHSAAF